MTDLEGTKPYYIAINVPKEHTDTVDAVIEKLKAQLESENKISC